MLRDINSALTGIPTEMVPALAGQRNPHAIKVIALRPATPAEEITRQVGAAISCFISAYKSFGGKA